MQNKDRCRIGYVPVFGGLSVGTLKLNPKDGSLANTSGIHWITQVVHIHVKFSVSQHP